MFTYGVITVIIYTKFTNDKQEYCILLIENVNMFYDIF